MTKPASRIFFEGKEIIDKEKVGKNLEYVFSDGSRITNSQLGKIEIECQECQKHKEIDLYYKIYEKHYICQSCQLTGERNPFYGKSHDPELKKRLSQERKGTWGVGEENAMFGKNVKDFVSPEKFEAMREKNRQDTLNREYNPFKTSMRIILGDERFEESLKKKAKTRSEWTDEQKIEYSRKISESQKRMQAADPVGYAAKKARGGIAAKAKAINYEMNKFETKVSNWLTSQNIRHTYSPIMSNGTRSFQYDFILHDFRILLECNGTYWHGDPRFFTHDGSDETLRKLNQTQKSNIEKDKRKKIFAKDKKFGLAILWEHDVNNEDYTNLTKELEQNEIKI